MGLKFGGGTLIKTMKFKLALLSAFLPAVICATAACAAEVPSSPEIESSSRDTVARSKIDNLNKRRNYLIDLGRGFKIRLEMRNTKLYMTRDGTSESQLLAESVAPYNDGAAQLLIEDVNFNGVKDLLIKVSDSASDACYQLMLSTSPRFSASSAQLAVFQEHPDILCNPAVDNDTKTVVSITHSGPLANQDIYRLSRHGELYLYARSEAIDYDFERLAIYNEAKEVKSSVITLRGITISKANEWAVAKLQGAAPNLPARACVLEKVTLHREPTLSTATKMYLIAGDSVSVIDVQGDDLGESWVKINFEGRKKIIAWLPRSAIEAQEKPGETCANRSAK